MILCDDFFWFLFKANLRKGNCKCWQMLVPAVHMQIQILHICSKLLLHHQSVLMSELD